MKTRERILKTAIETFNEKGFGAVNLLEVAQLMGISRGNLTYHFKTKEVLLEAIVKEMWAKIENEKKVARQLPSFENMHFLGRGAGAVQGWIDSVWHRTPVLSPWIGDQGYGRASGCDTMDYGGGSTGAPDRARSRARRSRRRWSERSRPPVLERARGLP